MIVCYGSERKYIPTEALTDTEAAEQLRHLSDSVAQILFPEQHNEDFWLASTLAMEILSNVVRHGGESGIIEIEPHSDGSLELSTSNAIRNGHCRNWYNPEVEAEFGHFGSIFVKRIAGEGNFYSEVRGDKYYSHTTFDPLVITRAH